MPPSPSLRFSPGREIRGDNNNKRGRSLESGRPYRDKDDDLALFSEMETKEKDNFLLQSNDDFEDILSSRMRYFSSNTLGGSIHTRGESSDLLNADGEKNDYDWLLTPPDTPLFRSLDDETPGVTLAQRGRPRSKPLTISRSSTMEKSYTSSRGSASPNRLSLSPRSQNSLVQPRGRPSTASRTSPTNSVRGTTPPRGPSPPPRKPSTPVPRSSTPTSRRASTPGPGGSSLSSGKRGVSPINKSRGNSASPKAKSLANIPDFSFEAPPNLRTSLGDRPSSYVRGSSPASRSVSSSYSHDRSKGSIASSGDDDLDSLQSVAIKSSDHSGPRRGGAYTGNHGPSLSRKSNRPGLSSSAPKRSFESPVRQMDHQRKTPQNMFRPLLSSVPSSTFYGKSTSAYRSLISRNSSITSSSNASSDPGPAGAQDNEGLDLNQDDTASTHGKSPYMDVEDDIFVLEKADTIGEIATQAAGSLNFDPLGSPNVEITTPEISETKSKFLEMNDSVEDRVICSKCGLIYRAIEPTDGELNLCPDCKSSEEPISSQVAGVMASEISPNLLVKNLDTSFDALEPQTSVAGYSGSGEVTVTSGLQSDKIVDETHIAYAERSLHLSSESSTEEKASEENVEQSPKAKVIDQPATCQSSSAGDKNEFLNSKLDMSEGTGISILLKRSSSIKGPLLQSRSFTATSISFDDMSYVRDCPTSMRSSTSSFDVHLKHRRSGSSLSGTSSHTFHGLGTNNNEIIVANDDNEVSVKNEEQIIASEIASFDGKCLEVVCHDHATDSADTSAFAHIDDAGSYENVEDFQHEARSLSDDDDGLGVSYDGDVADVADISNHTQLETISEIEIENGHPGSPESQSDDVSSDSSDRLDGLHELSASTRSDKDVAALVAESVFPDHAHDIHEESTVTVNLGTKAKSLTLEEATDAILFCSSIVQNIAYQAATIAIEKENSVPLEGSRPSVTILGNSNSNNLKAPRGKTISRRTPKSQKTRKKKTEAEMEIETKPSSTYEKSTPRIVGVPNRSDSLKPPKLESKCNCIIM